MPRLHLLNQAGQELPQPRHISPDVVESGCWLVSIERAEAMIGFPIHLHRRKAEPAFLSGVVSAYRRENYTSPTGRPTMRTVFTFTPGPDDQAVTDSSGWTPAGVKFVS